MEIEDKKPKRNKDKNLRKIRDYNDLDPNLPCDVHKDTHTHTVHPAQFISCINEQCSDDAPVTWRFLVNTLLPNRLTHDLFSPLWLQINAGQGLKMCAHSWLWCSITPAQAKICNWHLNLFAVHQVKLQRDCGVSEQTCRDVWGISAWQTPQV